MFFGHLTLKNHGICSGFCFSPRKNTVNNSNFAVFSCFSLFFELRWSAIHGYQILRVFFFRQSVLSDVFGLNGRHHWQLRAAAQRCGAGGCRREATWINPSDKWNINAACHPASQTCPSGATAGFLGVSSATFGVKPLALQCGDAWWRHVKTYHDISAIETTYQNYHLFTYHSLW